MRPFHIATLALCLIAVPAAHADDASRRAKAEEMLQLTKAGPALQEQLKNLQDRVDSLAKQQFGQGAMSPEQTKLSTEYLKQVDTITSDEVGWDKLHPAILQDYADSFTEPELDGIIAFYKSPSGQALIAKTPAVLSKTNTIVTDKIKEMQPKLASLTQDYAAKIKAAGPAPAAAPGPAAPTTAAPSLQPAPKPAARP